MTPIVFPLPLDNWELFKPDVQRFCETFRKFPPGADSKLAVMCNSRWPTDEEKGMFSGIENVEYLRYDGPGFDIGSHQYFAHQYGKGFCVNVCTRVYFNREGWLKKILEARDYFGPGLFGTAVFKEYGVGVVRDRERVHFRTHCYGIEASELREYPLLIDSKDASFMFESGAYNNPLGTFMEWCSARKHNSISCVFWDGAWRSNEWFQRPNIFRMGDQSNLLVFDRHSLIFDKATPEERDAFTSRTYYYGI